MYLAVIKRIWPYLLVGGLTFFVIWYIYFKGYNNGLEEGKRRQDKAIIEQQISLQQQCNQDKQLTNEVSNEFQNGISSVDDQLDRLRTETSIGIVSITDATSGHNERAEGREQIKRTIIARDKLYGFGGQCEKDRLQIKALQSFIKKVWTEK